MTDLEVIDAMRTYGGSFVKALAEAFARADGANQRRLQAAFPELWDEYEELARLTWNPTRASEQQEEADET